MKRKMRGSLTVESAVIVPLAIFVIGILFYSLFYYHDKVVLHALASEASIYGSYEENPTEEGLKTHLEQRIAGRLLLFSEVEHQIEIRKNMIEITAQTQKGAMSLHVHSVASRTEPEQYIRAIRKIKKIGEKEQK